MQILSTASRASTLGTMPLVHDCLPYSYGTASPREARHACGDGQANDPDPQDTFVPSLGELHTPEHHKREAQLQGDWGRGFTVPGVPGERPRARRDSGSTKSLRNLLADRKSCISRGTS